MRELMTDPTAMIEVRRARPADDGELSRVEVATWAPEVSPAPRPSAGAAFFGPARQPDDLLVAEFDGVVVGYAHLAQQIPVPAHQHVLELSGLGVDPPWQRHGVGRRLLQQAVREAALRGARKLSLRVLASNTAARRLYSAGGFAVEGVLGEEFLLAGRYVDDVLMALRLDGDDRVRR
jgi:ribosomal protein S18 acetylase RimI-like enzyme